MSARHYYQHGPYHSYVLADPDDRETMERIFLHRGRIFADGGFIADTAINLQFPINGDLAQLKEVSSWDTAQAPAHKLKRTAHFFVMRRERNHHSKMVLSGWIVPYDTQHGLPMEDRRGKAGRRPWDWAGYMDGRDEYLRRHGLAKIYTSDLVEIGRLCGAYRPDDHRSVLPVLLGFKTLHRFLEEVGVKNYVCAAIDQPRRRYASLYEGMGLRKVDQYDASTVTAIESVDGRWRSVVTPLSYWAMHINIPHTQQRILRGEFGAPMLPGAAKLNRRTLSFVTPYLFDPPSGEWQPECASD